MNFLYNHILLKEKEVIKVAYMSKLFVREFNIS